MHCPNRRFTNTEIFTLRVSKKETKKSSAAPTFPKITTSSPLRLLNSVASHLKQHQALNAPIHWILRNRRWGAITDILCRFLFTPHNIKFSSGVAGKLLFVSIGEQKLRDSGAKRRGVLEPVSKRESRFENTLEEASFLLLFLEGQKKEKNKDDSYYRSINYSPLTIHLSLLTFNKSQFSKNK